MDRRPIRQLPPSLVNRIAAGEVIERPASVVKELVENALDAGASSIAIDVEDGGRELIRVVDDGGGIPPGELPLAFAAHATSKLSSDEDLFRIATMGFRGEALASIGSVAHARILSRVPSEPSAYEIVNRGGAVSDPQASAGNVGTSVEVRHLFYNVPARRKFLRGAATEYGHVCEMVLRLALPRPDVSFRLRHGARVTLDLPVDTPERRWLAAWPEDFHEQRLPIDRRDAEARVRGLLGLPDLARPTAKHQHVFLNGRAIRDKFVQHALREAYRGLTEPGRYPAAIVLIEMPPGDVDVNVHPTKAEVRFRDSSRIHGLVLATARERLLGSDLTPAAAPRRGPAPAERQSLQERLAAFFRDPPIPTAPSIDAPGEPSAALPFAAPSGDASAVVDAPSARPPPLPLRPPPRGLEPTAPPLPRPPQDERPPAEAARPSPAIQIHNSYLVAETEDGVVIIDQHALHERIVFEELMQRLRRGPLEGQRLLIAQTFPATPRQIAILEQAQPLLSRLGIEASPFGPASVAVHAFPSFLDRLEPAEFVADVLERGEQEQLDLHDEALLHGVLDMMACKAAVKAGDPLDPAEIEALLARRDLIERSSNCPHGRPTTLRLSLRDLEKQFKRTGF